MKRVILGTAGHIDHGKTTLVKALTGIDTDRLPEEKARGITIDLGFAHLSLDGLDVGIVDVPGHEGLIRNMLAGATGFDAVLLVVAADEGVMPQTREHLAIARLLGVQRLVVALTKADLVDPEWLELVRADVTSVVAAFGSDTPVVPVSALTSQGLPELRAALLTQLRQSIARSNADVFRMPIDRVFSVHGTGTVVTGTVWSGCAAQHAAARILPLDQPVRIRAVQSHGLSVSVGEAGQRVAFALTGVERSAVARGGVLVTDAAWRATRVLTARLQLLEGVTLAQRQRVRVHLGTAEAMARTLVINAEWIQLRLEEPLVARAGDRFVLRSYSPVRTIGGGRVADTVRVLKRLDAGQLGFLATLLDGDAHDRICAAVELAGAAGSSIAELPLAAGVPPATVAAFLETLPAQIVRVNNSLFAAAIFEKAVEQVVRITSAHHAAFPLQPGIERAPLLSALPSGIAEAACHDAEQRGLVRGRGSLVALAGFEPQFSAQHARLRDELLECLRTGGLAPPTVAELSARLRSEDVKSVLRLLEAQGQIIAIALDLYVESSALAAATARVRALGNAGPVPANGFKAALPVSRKYLIPLLEYFDRTGVTRRDGEVRYVSSTTSLV